MPKPSFNLLQNNGSSMTPLIYYAFDVMVLAGKDLMGEPLDTRRGLLERKVLSKLGEPIRYGDGTKQSVTDVL
jgi:ATP-dependent DNA ligase